MWTWRYLAEDHLIILDKQLNPKDAKSAKSAGDCLCDFSGFGTRGITHWLRLPALPVVPVGLDMANRLTKRCAACMPDGKLGNFVIKIDEALDNDLAGPGTSALLCILPGSVDIVITLHRALSLAR